MDDIAPPDVDEPVSECGVQTVGRMDQEGGATLVVEL